MKRDVRKKAKFCEICKSEKYERKPVKQPLGSSPIPRRTGQMVSMDIFHIDNKTYVTSIDRFSKYLCIRSIDPKVNFHETLEEILTQNYPTCETIITDNGGIFVSHPSKAVYDKYGITHVMTPKRHSISNKQVERGHSTMIELARCLAKENSSSPGEEVLNAVRAYNQRAYNQTGQKPYDVN